VLYLAISGQFAGLGLVRELAAQGADFKAELGRHLALSGTSLLFGVAIGLPAAVAAHRRPAVAAWLLPTVAFFQTVPSLALFGLLLPLLARLGQGLSLGTTLLLGLLLLPLALLGRVRTPWLSVPLIVLAALPALLWVTVLATVVSGLLASILSGAPVFSGPPTLAAPLAVLGVRGIGAAPALLALILYSLLPIVRNTYEGLQGVPAAVVQAGRGMGMSWRQLLTGVELPLALPVMVAGIRAAAVLVVGITTVAFLIGAGGLGVFIQRGIDQVVPDLVLLGALPVIALALLADGGLRALGTLVTARPLRQEGQSAR
jgi:osmoprotectant transport system permease protein